MIAIGRVYTMGMDPYQLPASPKLLVISIQGIKLQKKIAIPMISIFL